MSEDECDYYKFTVNSDDYKPSGISKISTENVDWGKVMNNQDNNDKSGTDEDDNGS
ncbi:MAG: hypothetical protein AB2705_18920 [Candidatus Thiodiazotropha sp.]